MTSPKHPHSVHLAGGLIEQDFRADRPSSAAAPGGDAAWIKSLQPDFRVDSLAPSENERAELLDLLERYVHLDITQDAMNCNRAMQDSNLHRSARAAIAKAAGEQA